MSNIIRSRQRQVTQVFASSPYVSVIRLSCGHRVTRWGRPQKKGGVAFCAVRGCRRDPV